MPLVIKMHGYGIIHRDLNPRNIFIEKGKLKQNDTLKIIDFNVSKLVSRNI